MVTGLAPTDFSKTYLLVFGGQCPQFSVGTSGFSSENKGPEIELWFTMDLLLLACRNALALFLSVSRAVPESVWPINVTFFSCCAILTGDTLVLISLPGDIR